ncbi:MAG: SDR family oxidoreductase [Chthoniobacterales bacterium]|nr:SDR family oxidoreductase [Chthoniobacterales bacterium]
MNKETALVTGASSGIGLHLAHEFARHGHPLVIAGPVQSELETAAEEFRSEHGVEVRVVAKDLEQENSAQEIFDELQAAGVEVDILVNNAGHGFHGKWWELSLEKDLSMIRLNIEAVMRMTKLFLPPMLQRHRGRVLNTASVAGFMPGPMLATYYATKAFVLSWSEALATELDDTPITVTALCPGVTDTDFFEKGDAENIKARQSSNVMSPQDVAKEGYKALMDEELFVIPGAANKAMVATRRILPVTTQAKLNEKMNSNVPPEKATHERGEKARSSDQPKVNYPRTT